MEDTLIEYCGLMINLLSKLRAEGKITEEEYIKHTQLKMEFISKAPH